MTACVSQELHQSRRCESPLTPDLSALIQEVTDQDDWTEATGIVLIITGSDKHSGERDTMSFDGDGTCNRPMLDGETD